MTLGQINSMASHKISKDDPSSSAPRPSSHQDVIKVLLEGNARWVAGSSQHPRIDSSRRAELAQHGQKPFAAVLSCADSRVPPELLFDVGLGDLFVVRVAGNSPGKLEVQSLQYATEHLGAGTILVLGHQSCGAVTGAVEMYPASAPEFLAAIYPAIEEARYALAARGENAVDRATLCREAIDRHVATVVKQLRISCGGVAVAGARYDLDSGRVTMLAE